MNSARDRREVPGAARRCRADPRLRRARPVRDLRRRRPLRPRRVRGPAADGRADGAARARAVATGVDGPDDTKLVGRGGRKLAERKARRERSLRIAEQRRAAEDGRAGARCRPAPTWPPTTRCRPRRSGATGWSRASRWPTTRRCSTSGRPSSGQWGLRGAARRQGPDLRGTGRDRGPAAAALLAGPVPDRGHARGGRRLRLLPVREQGRRPDRARTTTAPSGPGSPSRGSAGTGGCAWPTSSGREDSGETDVVGFHGRHGGPADQRVRQRAVRGQRLPRLPRGARAVGAADRGAGRVLAPADPRGAVLPGGTSVASDDPDDVEDVLQARLPRCALLVRLPGLPDLEDQRQDRGSCWSRAGSACELSEEFQLHPGAVDRRRSSCTTPRRSTSTPDRPAGW